MAEPNLGRRDHYLHLLTTRPPPLPAGARFICTCCNDYLSSLGAQFLYFKLPRCLKFSNHLDTLSRPPPRALPSPPAVVFVFICAPFVNILVAPWPLSSRPCLSLPPLPQHHTPRLLPPPLPSLQHQYQCPLCLSIPLRLHFPTISIARLFT